MFKTRLPQHSPHHLCDSVNSSVSAIHSPLIKRILGDLKWVFIVFSVFACQDSAPSGVSADKADHSLSSKYIDQSAILAHVGEIKVTQATVERRLAELSPISRAKYQSPERKRELIDSLIRFELLAGEALKRGHGEHPEVKVAYKQAMVRQLLRHEIRDLVKIGDISDQEVGAYYQEHLSDYQRPQLVRASHILFSSEAEAQASLKKLRLHIKSDPKQRRSIFGDFASKESQDQETRARRGDLQYFNRKGQLIGDRLFPQSAPHRSIAEAAFALTAVGEVAATPIQSPKGWHLIQRTGGKRAFNRSLSDVKTEIRNHLFRARKANTLEDYVTDLKSKAQISIDEEALERLKVDASPKQRAPQFKLNAPLQLPQRHKP